MGILFFILKVVAVVIVFDIILGIMKHVWRKLKNFNK